MIWSGQFPTNPTPKLCYRGAKTHSLWYISLGIQRLVLMIKTFEGHMEKLYKFPECFSWSVNENYIQGISLIVSDLAWHYIETGLDLAGAITSGLM